MEPSTIPAEFSTVLGMGAPRSYHPVRRSHRIGNLILLCLLLGAAAAVFLVGAYDAYQAYTRHGTAMIADRLTGPAVAALVLTLLAVWAGWGAYSNWRKGAAVYENGIAYRDRRGLRFWRWVEVASLHSAVTRHYTNGIYTGTTHVYTLHNLQGEKLVLADQLARVEELAQAVEAGIFPALYEQAQRAYSNGETITAGPVRINREGIQIAKKTFPWTEVERVAVQQGVLKVSRKGGGWFSGASAMVSVIPNLRVLMAIIDQQVGIQAG